MFLCRWQHLKEKNPQPRRGWETLVMTAEALCDGADIERVMKAPPVTGDGGDKASHTSSLSALKSARHDFSPCMHIWLGI